jgi:hypothetical protein
MKSLKNGIRIWITGASVAGFLGGWVLLAHAPKPAPLQVSTTTTTTTGTTPTLAPLPTLPPLPSINGSSSTTNLQPLPALPQPQVQMSFPSMRTRGS